MKIEVISNTLFHILICLVFIDAVSSCRPSKDRSPYGPYSLMGQGYGIHSLILAVDNLDSAVANYNNALGFIMPRSDTFNVGFRKGIKIAAFNIADISTIELLSVDDSIYRLDKNPLIRDFIKEKEGVLSYSISSSDLDSTKGWLSYQGFSVDSVISYELKNNFAKKSKWNDGMSIVNTLGFDNEIASAYRPNFLNLADFPYYRMHEWSSFYNMQRGFLKHPNGVIGTTALKIAVSNLDSARNDFLKMGFSESEVIRSSKIVRFKLKRNQELHLVAPKTSDDQIAQFLRDNGPGVFAVVFEVRDLQGTSEFLKSNLTAGAFYLDSLSSHLIVKEEYANGIQLEFKEESAEQALLADQLNLNFGAKLDSTARDYAESMYIKYCALCHGKNREGYAADNAPSLRSHSLFASSQNSNFLRYAVQYGRVNTAMAGYYAEQGGPLELIEIELLLKWLEELSGVEQAVELSREPVKGNVTLGSKIYSKHCASCHGEKGEGISAPALGNPMLLATATDDFLRYAITEGRDDTPMPPFKDSLGQEEIDAITAFLRSRASGWEAPQGTDTIKLPLPEDYVLNPDNETPDFNLRDGQFVSAEQLNKALQDSLRFVLLDARSEVAWRQTHIPGAIPVPYYEEPEAFIEDIPNDGTWVVAYCACPHAASGQVIKTLKEFNFKNTAILDEGILVWAQLGYPVQHGH